MSKWPSLIHRIIGIATLTMGAVLTVGLNGWDLGQFREQQTINSLKDQTLKVHILEHPLVYKKESEKRIWGEDFEALQVFAQDTGLKLEFIAHKNAADLLASYKKLDGDVWVHRFPTFKLFKDDILKGPDLRESSYVGLCDKKAVKNNLTLRYLVRPVDLEASADYFNDIELNTLKTDKDMSFGQVAAKIRLGEVECTVAEIEMADWFTQRYSFLQKIELPDRQGTLSWWLHPSRTDLADLMHVWFKKQARQNALQLVTHKALYSTLDESDLKRFNKSIESVLPYFSDLMKQAAREVQLPWQFIAAVAYQESHWNPTAVSYTGATGLMQITEPTAEYLGVNDRENSEENVKAGARYLAELFDKTSEESPHFDRVALTLASYNLGARHVANLQKLAIERGLDPNRWTNIKALLPELSTEAYKTRFGAKARGFEAEDFVQRTLSYYHVLLSI